MEGCSSSIPTKLAYLPWTSSLIYMSVLQPAPLFTFWLFSFDSTGLGTQQKQWHLIGVACLIVFCGDSEPTP